MMPYNGDDARAPRPEELAAYVDGELDGDGPPAPLKREEFAG